MDYHQKNSGDRKGNKIIKINKKKKKNKYKRLPNGLFSR